MERVLTKFEKRVVEEMCDLRVKDVAEVLCCHKNTVYYHINRIYSKTGLNPKVLRDLLELRELI